MKHLDETGFRIGGRTQWLHVLSTELWIFYRTHPRRGSVLEGFRAGWCRITESRISRCRRSGTNSAMSIICGSCRPRWNSTGRLGRGGCSGC